MKNYWQPKYDRGGVANAEAEDFREMLENYEPQDEDTEGK